MNTMPLVIISGPTAVGKTELSIELAKKINGEIISADSMQVYKGLDIGTAKISREEQQNIPHYLIDEYDPQEEFNVYEFQKKAKEYIELIYKKNKIPIIVGGTGFYIQSVLYDIDFSTESNDKKYRLYLEKLAAEHGNLYLHTMLKEVDLDAANEIHPNNVKRVIRALEYNYETGNLISSHNQIQKQKTSPYNFAYFVLNRNRDTIYRRINSRVDVMIDSGLIDEVSSLINRGLNENLVSMQGLGYKEIIQYIKGEISKEEAIERIKKNTRHFAKRQLTWFKRERDVCWIDYENFNTFDDMLDKMIDYLKEKKIV